MICIREVGVDEMTWKAIQKETDDWYKEEQKGKQWKKN